MSPHGAEAPAPEGETESPADKPVPASPESDSKTASSGESSDEEDEEKEEEAKESEANSILPSSVLDKASAIAQHFTNSTRRGSLAMDDANSLGCSSPRLPSSTGSTLSLGGEPNEKSHRLTSTSSEPQENFGMTDLTQLSPRDDSLFDSDRGCRVRRDSILSKQDQLLICKIRSYYETAENQDADFCLRRRESLTYIPTGLVRNSVSRFNSIPNDEALAAEKNPSPETVQTDPSPLTTSPIPDPSTTEQDSASGPEPLGRMVSSASFDSLFSNEKMKESQDSGFNVKGNLNTHRLKARSRSMQEESVQDEEFRPSSEMIKIWQAMERETSISQVVGRGHEKPRGGAQRNSRGASRGLSSRNQTPNKNSEKDILEESDLSTITEESMSPSPLKHKVLRVSRSASWKDALKPRGDEGRVLRAPVPRVVQLRAEAEGEPTSEEPELLDDAEKAKNKVLQLARQYSQRIKTTKPVVRQRSQDVLFGRKNLPCLIEEKESSGTIMSCLAFLLFLCLFCFYQEA